MNFLSGVFFNRKVQTCSLWTASAKGQHLPCFPSSCHGWHSDPLRTPAPLAPSPSLSPAVAPTPSSTEAKCHTERAETTIASLHVFAWFLPLLARFQTVHKDNWEFMEHLLKEARMFCYLFFWEVSGWLLALIRWLCNFLTRQIDRLRRWAFWPDIGIELRERLSVVEDFHIVGFL